VLLAGAHKARPDRFEDDERNAQRDPHIGNVEDIPVKSEGVKTKKVGHGAIENAVIDVSEGPSEDEADGERGNPVLHTGKPEAQPDNDRNGEAREKGDARRRLRLEQAIADPLV